MKEREKEMMVQMQYKDEDIKMLTKENNDLTAALKEMKRIRKIKKV